MNSLFAWFRQSGFRRSFSTSRIVDWKLAREFDMKANENPFNYVDNGQNPSIFIKQRENIVSGQVFGIFFVMK